MIWMLFSSALVPSFVWILYSDIICILTLPSTTIYLLFSLFSFSRFSSLFRDFRRVDAALMSGKRLLKNEISRLFYANPSWKSVAPSINLNYLFSGNFWKHTLSELGFLSFLKTKL